MKYSITILVLLAIKFVVSIYNGSQVLRVKCISRKDLEIIDKLKAQNDVQIWSRHGIKSVDVLVTKTKLESVKKSLNNYTVLINDVAEAIANETPPPSKIQKLAARKKKYKLTWNNYHSYANIQEFVQYMAKTYPSKCKSIEIGKTIEGRPLTVLKISSTTTTKNKKIGFWIDGGIHAREWISPAVVTYIIKELLENSAYKELLTNVDFHILPVVNPDGYEYSRNKDRMWRKNRRKRTRCSGTDLNRNFGFEWGGAGTDSDICGETYPGTKAFSEPEAAAIRDYIIQYPGQFQIFLTYHSYGQTILTPWGYKTERPNDYKELEAIARKATAAIKKETGATYTVGSSASSLYLASGVSDDWSRGSQNIKYSFTIELRDIEKFGFLLPAKFIIPTCKDAMAATKVFAEEMISLKRKNNKLH